jgi:hypothetical protein
MPATAPLAPTAALPSMPCSSSLQARDSSLVSEPCSSFSLSQDVADALYAAAEAKAAVLATQQQLSRAIEVLDQLVEAGVLPAMGLPTVSGFVIYRQEGRVSWSYPQSIKALEASLKKRKQLAEQLGEATQKRGNPFWTIKPTDEEIL